MRCAGDAFGYQVLLAKNPNCGCRETRTMGGATWRFAVLRFGCGLASGFGSGLLASVGCGCLESGSCNCANASRTRTLVETSATVTGAGTPASSFATCAGAIVGRLVSNTTRSGHFRSV